MNDDNADIDELETLEDAESNPQITVVSHESSSLSSGAYELEEVIENNEPRRYGWRTDRLEPGHKTIWFKVIEGQSGVFIEQSPYNDDPENVVFEKTLSFKLDAPDFVFGIVGSHNQIQEINLYINQVSDEDDELCYVKAFEEIEAYFPIHKGFSDSCSFTINLRPKKFELLWSEVTRTSDSEFSFGIADKCLHHDIDPIGGYPVNVVRVLTNKCQVRKHKSDLELFDSTITDRFFFRVNRNQAMTFESSKIEDIEDGDSVSGVSAIMETERERNELSETIKYKEIVYCLYILITLLALNVIHSVFS